MFSMKKILAIAGASAMLVSVAACGSGTAGDDGGKQEIVAECPMAELGDYAIKLRSITQGRGSFVSQFERYDEAPGPVQEKVIAANKARLEALNKE